MGTVGLTTAHTGTYVIDSDRSTIGFAVRCLLPAVRGTFTRFDGTGYFDALEPTRSSISLRVHASSIETRNAKRDEHLRSPDYLAADLHPDITFTSTAVEPVGAMQYRVTGDLTIRGILRPVMLDVRRTDADINDRGAAEITLAGRAVLDRNDWGVRWSTVLEGGGLFIGNKVTVDFSVTAVRGER